MTSKTGHRICPFWILLLVVWITASGMVTPNAALGDDGPLNSYVVVLEEGSIDPSVIAKEHAFSYGIDVDFIYRYALAGYSAKMEGQTASLISTDLRVQSVRRDTALDVVGQTIPTGVDRIYDPANNNSLLAGLTVNGSDDQRVDADIAILDTGIDHTHPDLNVVGGTDCREATPAGTCADGLSGDASSHGTHVAGIAAALDNGIGVVGVAPGARLWAVRVAGPGANFSSLMAGIDWVTARASTIEVANVSLKCTLPCEEVNLAIRNSVAAGVTYTVAAGNSGEDASLVWPANSPEAITVSALADADGRSGGLGWFGAVCDQPNADGDDTLAGFSNYGLPIDVAAPGKCIYSTIPGGYWWISGTSMAAPHVAGAAALLASQPAYHGNPSLIRQAILENGNFDWIDGSGDGLHEPLVDVTTFSPVTVIPVVNQPPKASFTKNCSGATCSFTSTSTDPDGTIRFWSWTFGDGTSGGGPNETHTYSAAGKYKVTLTVVDERGATSSASQSVTCQTQKGKLSCR